MQVEDFLKRAIEEYLLSDLGAMDEAKGGLVYPMAAATCSGIELLGDLLHKFAKRRTSEPFSYYWDHYLSKRDARYQGLGSLVYSLVRNGIAHCFVVKPGLALFKGDQQDASRHLYVDRVQKQLFIDVQRLYMDFENSYQADVRPILYSTALSAVAIRSQMQANLDAMIEAYECNTESEFGGLSPEEGLGLASVTTVTTVDLDKLNVSSASFSFPAVPEFGAGGDTADG